MTEQTVKCRICGEPYKFYWFSAADQSACPDCVAKAEKKSSESSNANQLPPRFRADPFGEAGEEEDEVERDLRDSAQRLQLCAAHWREHGKPDGNSDYGIRLMEFTAERINAALARLRRTGEVGEEVDAGDLEEQVEGLLIFLTGEAAYEGVWFGDDPSERPEVTDGLPFWWRSALVRPVLTAVLARLRRTPDNIEAYEDLK